VLVDVATLTGAIEVALGKRHAGLFCSDERLAGQLEAAAAPPASRCGGCRWWTTTAAPSTRRSPTCATWAPQAQAGGGAIVAALYLREFTGGRPWAHLDIAGPVSSGADEDERTKGGTGYGVRLLTAWLQELSRAEQPAARRPARRAPARASRRTA
jgi:leucyl aminopeptidase